MKLSRTETDDEKKRAEKRNGIDSLLISLLLTRTDTQRGETS